MDHGDVIVTCEDRIAWIVMDSRTKRVNVWDNSFRTSMLHAIYEVNDLAASRTIEAAVIISGKKNVFHTGGDLGDMDYRGPKDMTIYALNESTHWIQNQIEDISVPVIAAIDGYCMGGGLEIALVCDARIARDGEKTIFSLPELGVGIIPGGGGTYRALQLIGYHALDMIYESQQLKPDEALEIGLIDRICPKEADFYRAARDFAKELTAGTAKLKRPNYDFSDLDAVMTAYETEYAARHHGRVIPGAVSLSRAIRKGVPLGKYRYLDMEKRLMVDLLFTPEKHGFANSFTLQGLASKPQKLASAGHVSVQVKTIGMVGLNENNQALIDSFLKSKTPPEKICVFAEVNLEANKITFSGIEQAEHISFQADITELTASDMIFVSSDNREDILLSIYERASEACPVVCVLEHPTDHIPEAVSKRKNFAALCPVMAPWPTKCVEIFCGPYTSTSTVDMLLDVMGNLRKIPILCRSMEGSVVQRLLSAMFTVGLRFVGDGTPAAEVDAAFLHFGYPKGLFPAMKAMGYDALCGLSHQNHSERKILETLAANGFFKEEAGMMSYADIDRIVCKGEYVRSMNELEAELLDAQLLEAKLLLDNGFVDSPRFVDMAALFACGYPKDKGGVICWGDLTGRSAALFGQSIYQDMK